MSKIVKLVKELKAEIIKAKDFKEAETESMTELVNTMDEFGMLDDFEDEEDGDVEGDDFEDEDDEEEDDDSDDIPEED